MALIGHLLRDRSCRYQDAAGTAPASQELAHITEGVWTSTCMMARQGHPRGHTPGGNTKCGGGS